MEKIKQQIKELLTAKKQVDDKISMFVSKTLKENGREITFGLVLGNSYWNCKKSPLGVCVYDHLEDHVHDFCLYCGQPEERK